jgi:hypothetical protein
METRVQIELDQLRNYARAVAQAAEQAPDRVDVVHGGRGYLGGALTTLHHVGLLTDEEHHEWWERLMDELPPTQWIAG